MTKQLTIIQGKEFEDKFIHFPFDSPPNKLLENKLNDYRNKPPSPKSKIREHRPKLTRTHTVF